MRRLSRTCVLSAAVVGLVGGSPAAAEPISITSGVISMPDARFEPAPTTLSGTDGIRSFTFDGFTSVSESFFAGNSCVPCARDATSVSIDVTAASSIFGDVMYGSESYVTGSGFHDEEGGIFLSILGQASLPASQPEVGEIVIINAPFTMTGTLFPPVPGGGRGNTLVGSGMASVKMFGDPADGITPAWAFRSAEYQFLTAPDPGPVPEPASVLLLSSGLAALALRRRRARQGS